VNSYRRSSGLFTGIAVFAICILAPRVVLPNWDVVWYFEVLQRLIEGERLYRDIIEVNFPWAIYIYMPAVWLSNLIGGSPFVWLELGIAVLVLINLAAVDRYLNGSGDAGTSRRWIAYAAVVLVLVVLPGGAFGQREHLAVLLTLPYLLARLSSTPGSGESDFRLLAALSLLAGLGFALKPFFVFPWLATTIFVTRRDWSPGNVALICLSALPMAMQLVVIPIVFPDLMELYGSFGRQYSQYVNLPMPVILVYWGQLLVFSLVLIAAAGVVQPDRRWLARGLAGLSFAWFITGLVQGKGWGYHFVPAQMTVVLAGVVAVVYFDRSRIRYAIRALLVACLFLLLAGDARTWIDIARADSRARRSELPASIRNLPDGMRGIVLSVTMPPSFLVLDKLETRNVGSFSFSWPVHAEYWQSGVPGEVVPVRKPSEMAGPESLLFAKVVKDLVEKKPEILLVSNGTDIMFNNGYFDEVAYFSQDAAFRAEMKNYERGPALGEVRIYLRSDVGR